MKEKKFIWKGEWYLLGLLFMILTLYGSIFPAESMVFGGDVNPTIIFGWSVLYTQLIYWRRRP
jgi:hypothetical protein